MGNNQKFSPRQIALYKNDRFFSRIDASIPLQGIEGLPPRLGVILSQFVREDTRLNTWQEWTWYWS